jgi:anti-sigma factor RsiW
MRKAIMTHDEYALAHEGHEEASLLPWYVNGTLEGEALARVQAHLRECPHCRREVIALRTLSAHLQRQPAPAAAPEAAFARFAKTLQASPAAARPTPHPSLAQPARRWRRSATPLALAASALLLCAPWAWLQLEQMAKPSFRTLSDAQGLSQPAGDLRLMLDRRLSAERIAALLAPIGGQILAESEAKGIYTIRLQPNSAKPVGREAAVAYLRSQEGVLLAEPILQP